MKLHPTGVVLLGGAMSLGSIALLVACERHAAAAAPHGDVPAAHDSATQAPWTSDISERVRKVVAQHLGVDLSKVTENAKFIDLGADSLDLVELTMAFEEEFNIEIPDDAAEHIETVGDAVRAITDLQSKAIRPQDTH
jgi:acyl carrier protein